MDIMVEAKEKAEAIETVSEKALKECTKVDFRPFEERVYSRSALGSGVFELEDWNRYFYCFNLFIQEQKYYWLTYPYGKDKIANLLAKEERAKILNVSINIAFYKTCRSIFETLENRLSKVC